MGGDKEEGVKRWDYKMEGFRLGELEEGGGSG